MQTPLSIPDEAELAVTMWRRTDDRRVWYEWLVDVYVYLPSGSMPHGRTPASSTSRASARKVRVGGSTLHSSEKDACLM